MKICIIGDSNSTPHQIQNDEMWSIQDMYWFPLTKLNFEIIPISFVKNSTKRILEMSGFF